VIALVLLLGAWGGCALWYQCPARILAVALWLVFCVAVIVALAQGFRAMGCAVFGLVFIGLCLWWSTIRPSNQRDWADDVTRMATGEVIGNHVTLDNVRNFDWRTNTDYIQRWETRSYDLRKLKGVDLVLSYWSMAAIAHVLVSFEFEDGQCVVFSVEIRRERTEAFSEIGGFFKEFELSIIAADERDVIRVRTNVRGEDDYLYRLAMPVDDMRSLFLSYVNEANELAHAPRFYNTLTVNCTTLVYEMMRRIVGRLPLDYRLLLSGYLPGYVHKVGGLDTRFSVEQLREMGRITERARRAERRESFSQEIRVGVPPLETGQ
jgi:Domain of unknown function (DUF4105)